ncbi:MAG: MarR family winged helix-turn-helix transcriptional regulator [Pseudonocardiaceae bacterium]
MRELALRVRDLIVAGDRYRQALAAALGVGVPETVALEHLFHAGRLTPTAIAERLGVTTASVTGLLDRLAASGYLARSPNPRDRRSVLVSLTDNGHRAIQASFDLFAADIGRAVAGAEPVEQAGLQQLLQHAAAVLHQRAADPQGLAELLAAGRDSAGDTPEPRESSAP